MVGRNDGDVCPVAAGVAYMVARGSLSGPFFTFSDGKFLTRDRFIKAVRAALTSAGVVSGLYSGTVSGSAQRRRLRSKEFQMWSSKQWVDGKAQPTLCMFVPHENNYVQWLEC